MLYYTVVLLLFRISLIKIYIDKHPCYTLLYHEYKYSKCAVLLEFIWSKLHC